MANLRVLLADSDTTFRTSAQRALTRQGYLVIPAANGVDALTVLSADRIDVLVAAVNLQAPDGMEVARAAKVKSPTMPAILLMDPDAPTPAESSTTWGASDCAVKPVDDPEKLVQMVEKVAGGTLSEAVDASRPEHQAASNGGTEPLTRFLGAAASGQELEPLLALYVQELAQMASARQAVVMLSHNDGQLHLRSFYGFSDRADAARTLVAAGGEEFPYQAAAAKGIIDQSLQASSGEAEADVPGVLIGLPLVYSRDVLGAAIVFSKNPSNKLAADALEGMRYLTQQAAMSVELSLLRGLADRRNPTDTVTGLYNREHFFELAEREFRRSWRFGEKIAAVQLDIDEFSRLRLSIGQSELDETTRQVARAVHTHVRNIDVVGRMDQDKFGILLLNTTKEFAIGVAERLRRAVAEIEVSTSEGTWQVTASLGVAVYPREQCASVHDLFGLSAQATRAATRAGHNRVVGV